MLALFGKMFSLCLIGALSVFACAAFLQYTEVGRKIDAAMLDVTAKFVKLVNWTTGKDNFWLARVATTATGIVLFLALLYPDLDVAFVLAILTVSPIWLWSIWVTIKDAENAALKAALRGAKQIEEYNDCNMLRGGSWAGICFACVLAITGNSRHARISGGYATVAIMAVGALAISYLISIDKPPFKRCMLWQWLKTSFLNLQNVLTPTPQLVPAHAPHHL